jgi:iron complex outermembrane receptor protein
MLNADEYRELIKERYKFDPNKPLEMQHAAIRNLGTESVNWQDLIYRDAVGVDHNLSFSGAAESLPFRVSLGVTDKDGMLKTDNFRRYTAGINLSPTFLDNRLQVNIHLKGMSNNNHFADRGAIGNSLNFDPTRGPYDANSPYGGFTTWTVPNGNPNNIAPTNPLALLEQRNDNSTVNQYITNANINYRLKSFPDLLLNLTLGNDNSNGRGMISAPANAAFAFDAANGSGFTNNYRQKKNNSILESYANYKKGLGNHNLDLMAGYSWQHFRINSFFYNSNLANNQRDFDPYDSELYLISLYSRLNYNFKERYYLTFNIRRDGTSRFSPDNRWGWFPGASLAVKVLDNENKFFNTLKLRVGLGTVGQQDIGDDYYAYLAKYTSSNPFARYQFGNTYIETLRPEEYDANLKWEQNTTYNVAADISLVKNLLSTSVDIYQKNTKDLLNRIPVPAGTNLSNIITTNVGNMESKGIEVSMNITPMKGWEFAANFAYNQSTITKLTAVDDPSYKGIATGGISGGVGSNIQRHAVGYSPSTFYVYKQLYDESGNLLEGKYEDVNKDGLTNSSDFYYFNNPFPKYTIGFTNNLNVANFDFSFAGRANIGNYAYNNVLTDMGYLARAYASNNVHWGVHQSAVDLNVVNQSALTFSDHFISNASFLRLDHVTLGYNLPKFLNGVRIYATIQNPLVVTKYKGLDPELGNGIDNNIYPRPRTFLGGISVNF